MQEAKGMGYCLFPVLGRDPEMESRLGRPGVRDKAHRPGVRPSRMRVQQRVR